MGKGKGKDKRSASAAALTPAPRGKPGKIRKPKSKCCVSKSRCKRCPIQMLREGTLPEGYTVHKRKLVKTSAKMAVKGQKKLSKAA